jgi:hypothetical protein
MTHCLAVCAKSSHSVMDADIHTLYGCEVLCVLCVGVTGAVFERPVCCFWAQKRLGKGGIGSSGNEWPTAGDCQQKQ